MCVKLNFSDFQKFKGLFYRFFRDLVLHFLLAAEVVLVLLLLATCRSKITSRGSWEDDFESIFKKVMNLQDSLAIALKFWERRALRA